ncbi:hypothetical protein KVT40_005407 [Elsinoe batatas]|uniref:Uncharacterized protein n=1 Tax=Elsinoe batatas TaxID=2601811 RepID=A0A8K0PFD2_9PEZI|nr:hypothetical protein KVT40_005407 [Elsinoe batatas]
MAPVTLGLSHLSNPLATPDQLSQSASQLAGVPRDLEESTRYRTSSIIQAVGILLRLPQQTIAETIVIFCRFWIGSKGGSLLDHSAKDIAAAALYLVTKPGPYPLSPKQILNALYYVIHASEHDVQKSYASEHEVIPLYTEGQIEIDRAALLRSESHILQVLGFQLHVALPHALCINYLQTLGVLTAESGHELTRRAYAHLNSSLLNPQLIYLTHQPCDLAAAAIYLGARETEVNLPDEPWWEVFDVDREDLGFLVVAMTSMAGFAEDQEIKARIAPPPLTSKEVRDEIGTVIPRNGDHP